MCTISTVGIDGLAERVLVELLQSGQFEPDVKYKDGTIHKVTSPQACGFFQETVEPL